MKLDLNIRDEKEKSLCFFIYNKAFYFIPSSDFNAYLKQIKVILSAVKKYRIFFTSDEYDLYFSL